MSAFIVFFNFLYVGGVAYYTLIPGVMPIDLIELYYSAKKKLASGCEPEFLSSLISRLKALVNLRL